MPASTQQDPADDGISPADGATLYDSIMADIEPDLLTANLESIEALIAKDTPAQRKARAVRYATAFQEYEKRFRERQKAWEADFKVFKRTALRITEKSMVHREKANLSALEGSMSATSAA